MTTRVAAIILAAGRGSRFGGDARATKLVAQAGGVPLVRAVATRALASRAASVTVVSGHAHDDVAAALAGIGVTIVHNAHFAAGMAGSLNTGLAAVASAADGVLVLLADMAFVTVETLDRLIAQFAGRMDAVDAITPVFDGKRGNPCLLGRRLYDRVRALRGDEGARHLLSQHDLVIDRCDVNDPGILMDIDTPEDLEHARCGETKTER